MDDYKNKIIPEPISIFFNCQEKDLKYYDDGIYQRKFYCMQCGLPVADMTAKMVYAVDNPGIPLEEMTGMDFIEVRCKRCKQPYRFFL